MQRFTVTPKKIWQLVVIMLLLPPVAFVLWVMAALAWIQYRPLPPVPRYGIDYSVKDAGGVGGGYLGYYYPDSFSLGARLTAAGMVAHLNEAAEAQDEAKRKNLNVMEAQRLGLTQRDCVDATVDNGHALVRTEETWTLFRNGRPAAEILKGVRGYSWKPQARIFGFRKLNGRDEAIGNGRIATAYASSGGTSNPHGRWLPLIWHGETRQPEDLNSHIGAQSGWYLDRAVDINGSGQILCIARQTDARGAEDYHLEGSHWVVLTPKR